MPRAIWSGAISFGLVNIPIKLYGAVSRMRQPSSPTKTMPKKSPGRDCRSG